VTRQDELSYSGRHPACAPEALPTQPTTALAEYNLHTSPPTSPVQAVAVAGQSYNHRVEILKGHVYSSGYAVTIACLLARPYNPECSRCPRSAHAARTSARTGTFEHIS